MTYEVVILPTAEDDLNALFDFIADQSGAVVAQRYVGSIEAFCMKLASFPNRGTPRGDLAPGIRTVSFERSALMPISLEAKSRSSGFSPRAAITSVNLSKDSSPPLRRRQRP